MMDPPITGLSFESPCIPSLGSALLIKPKTKRKLSKVTAHKQYCVHFIHSAAHTLKWSAFSATVSPAHGSFNHVVSAFQLVACSGAAGVFPGVLDSFRT